LTATDITNKSDPDLTPAVKAYMVQASTELAKEQGFFPANENEVGCWMMNNREAITKRSIEIQWGLLDRLKKNPETMRALSTILSAQVWLAANRNQVNEVIQNVVKPEETCRTM
jgi:hypothetical protein